MMKRTTPDISPLPLGAKRANTASLADAIRRTPCIAFNSGLMARVLGGGLCLQVGVFSAGCKICGVEPEGATGVHASLARVAPVTLPRVDTVAASPALPLGRVRVALPIWMISFWRIMKASAPI